MGGEDEALPPFLKARGISDIFILHHAEGTSRRLRGLRPPRPIRTPVVRPGTTPIVSRDVARRLQKGLRFIITAFAPDARSSVATSLFY